MAEARSVVAAYMDWWKSEKRTPILRSSEMFHALLNTYAAPALRAGWSRAQVANALAGCARGGAEWPSEQQWRRALDGKFPGQPGNPQNAPRPTGAGVWDRVVGETS
jgi:hypothetical protein